MASLHIIYASSSGHTEYVVQLVQKYLQQKHSDVAVSILLAEQAQPEDLLKGDVLILASGTWNTGGIEGQLNPHMHEYLIKRAASADLNGKKVGIIALGDERYYYTCRANEHFRQFIMNHNGKVQEPALLVVNEPYGQEEKVERWAEKFLVAIK